MEFTLNLTTGRGYPESWDFHWVTAGWEIKTFKWNWVTDPEGRELDLKARTHPRDLYYSFGDATITYPSTFPSYLRHLWEWLRKNPDYDLQAAVVQLETWFEAIRVNRPQDPALIDPII